MSRAFDRFKASAFLVLVGGYLIFNYPFMPFVLGELFLIVILLSTNVPRVLSRMNATVFLFPFMIWWSWGFGRLIFDTMGKGFWAFRDATQLIDSLFLIVGFTLAGEPRTVTRLAYWLRPIVIICCIYAMLFGYGDDIAAISPTLPGASGQAISIFGAYAIPSTVLLWGAVFCVIQPARSPAIRMRYLLVAGLLIAFALAVIQARTTYLQLLSVAGLLLVLRPRALSGLGFGIPVFFSILIVISALDIRISGRLTSDLSLSFFWEHIQSIVGISEKAQGGLASAADGVSMRLGWWNRLYDQLTADEVTLITGLGYGIPLTNFSDTLGVTTREPHNSVISVAARLGLIGVGSWIWMQVELFRAGFRAYFDCRRTGRSEAANFILLCVAFAVLTLSSCFGEDAMEKPYNAITYYAFWGFVLRIGCRLRAEAARGHFAYRAPQAAGASRPSTL
jgi:hypothetical protein